MPEAAALRPRLHYAWVVTALTALVLLAAAGTRTAPQVLLRPLEAEFGWSRAGISFAVAVSILWFGLGGPLAGKLVERFGLRGTMAAGLSLVAAGLGLLPGLGALWQLHLFWGLAVGIGTGMLANVLGAVVAQRWFSAHRGLVVGLMGAASAAGQLIFLPGMIALTDSVGWRGAITAAAVCVAALILPVLILMRERPAQLGLTPYGGGAPGPANAAAEAAAESGRPVPLAEAARTREFWLLAGSFFVCGYTTNGLIGTHLLPHALEHGFSSQAAGAAIAVMGAMNILGTLASGWLSDRFDNRWLLAGYYFFRAVSIAALPFVADYSGLLIFAVVYGLDWIATVPPTIQLTGQRFGRASVGWLYGWIFFAHMVGAALAAYLGGVLRVALGDYTLAFLSAAALGVVAAGFSVSLPARRQPQPAAEPAAD